MEGALSDSVDRRRATRLHCVDSHGIVSIQLRPGHGAMLINICQDGALIETDHRLLPGTTAELLLERRQYRASVRGRVLRCSVVRLQASAMCYRGAIGFDRSLPWFVEHERPNSTEQVV